MRKNKKVHLPAVLLLLALFSSFRQKTDDIYIIRMEGMKFIPKTIEIPEGATVRWINNTDGAHNIVAKDGQFKSNMLTKKGEQYEVRFSTKGTYQYYCAPHRIMGMKGTVVVK